MARKEVTKSDAEKTLKDTIAYFTKEYGLDKDFKFTKEQHKVLIDHIMNRELAKYLDKMRLFTGK